MKYPPVLLVLVGDGDHHSFSSSPHLLPRGVIAEQGKARQLILMGTPEIWKAEKKSRKDSTTTTAISQPCGSISILIEHT